MRLKCAIKQILTVFATVAIIALFVSCPSDANEDYTYNPLLGTWTSVKPVIFEGDDLATMYEDYIHIAFSSDTVIFYAPSVGSTEALPYTFEGDYYYSTVTVVEDGVEKIFTISNRNFTSLNQISVFEDFTMGASQMNLVDSSVLLEPGLSAPEENTTDYILSLNSDMTGYTIKGFKSGIDLPEVIDNLPTEYNGLPVTGIASGAFSGGLVNNVTTKIVIPENIIDYTSAAFDRCTYLEEVVVQSSVIPSESFKGVSGKVTIGENVKEIGAEAFAGAGIETIKLPEGLEKIGAKAFADSSLTSLTIPSSVKEVGVAAFSECDKLVDLNIEAISDENILNGALSGYPFFESYTIPDGTTKIPGGAFADCTGLKSVTIPSSVKEIGSSAFSGCTALEEIDISSVTSLGYEDVFYGCTNLKKVILSDDLKEIPLSCFRACTNLVEINLPSGLDEIGSYAFYDCSNLIISRLPSNVFVGSGAFVNTGATEVTIQNDVDYGDYSSAYGGCLKLEKVIIEEGVEKIADYMFSGCEELKEVQFASTVTEIGDSAFSYCSALTSMDFPSSLDTIGYSAFTDCTNIKKLVIPESVREMGYRAFVDWTAEQTIVVPFREGYLPRGWDKSWNDSCDAVIEYL